MHVEVARAENAQVSGELASSVGRFIPEQARNGRNVDMLISICIRHLYLYGEVQTACLRDRRFQPPLVRLAQISPL